MKNKKDRIVDCEVEANLIFLGAKHPLLVLRFLITIAWFSEELLQLSSRAMEASSKRKSSTQILTIRQMIESLTNSRNQLSTAVKTHITIPQSMAESNAGDQIQPISEPTHQFDNLGNLLNHIDYLIDALTKTIDLEDKLNNPIQVIQSSLFEILEIIEKSPPGSSLNQRIELGFLDELSNDIENLKFHIPCLDYKLSLAGFTNAHLNRRAIREPPHDRFELPDLYGDNDEVFKESFAFKDIKQVIEGFDDIHRQCFLHFAVFPENAVLKKRFLTHWWVGEGLLDPFGTGDETPESVAGRILQEFTDKDLIMPVKEEQKKIKKKFKLSPLVRSAVIILAKEMGIFDYDSWGNPTANSERRDRIFLGSQRSELLTSMNSNFEERMESIFNVSEPFPDSVMEWWAKKGNVDIRTVKVVEWLLKMKNLKVLYLGRWQSATEEHHIEVESTEFLKGLKNMRKLRLLSLQGISWITRLPNSIKKLSDLRVLDLKSSHNLEKLPDGIRSLKRLTHLDISGCYLLDWMPKGISALTELRVLKGFVVGRSSLSDLKGLKKLRKLSISSTREDFPDGGDLRALKDLGELRNLTMAWGAATALKQPPRGNVGHFKRLISKQRTMSATEVIELPDTLEKLDLQCLPRENLPTWLNSSSLKSLKKLYIRGGGLKDLGHNQWAAEVLRLKFLTDLKMEWRKLLMDFPNLTYLQRVKCPRVTFCPCDENGVWMKMAQ